SGPVAPLNDFISGHNYSISHSVSHYLGQGIEPKRLILGLPFYGARWETKNNDIPSATTKFIGHPNYSVIESDVRAGKGRLGLDKNSATRYLIVNKNNKTYQTWFDDSTTLATKFDWAKQKGLAGVSPWTLSYTGGYNDLWELLGVKFGVNYKPRTIPSTKTSTKTKAKAANTSKDVEQIPQATHHKFLTRINTMNYFHNTDSCMEKIMDDYQHWKFKKNPLLQNNTVPTHKIYGFYPYWNDNKGLKFDFRLYTRIGYYAAIPNAKTGKIEKSFNWNRLDFDLPRQHGCKVDLVVASPFKNIKSKLLDRSKVSSTFMQEILTLVQQSGGDGITLDFGHLNKHDKDNLTQFVATLSKSLKNLNPEFQLNFMLPPIIANDNKHFAYDFNSLSQYIDNYLFTGFDYHGTFTKYAGPNAPLYGREQWLSFNINSSILQYSSLGVKNSQLILVVPYFGKKWKTHDFEIPSKAKGLIKFLSYNEFFTNTASSCDRVFDSASLSPCYHLTENNENYQIWIDDSVSIGLKYKYAIKNNLAGVGIWALGYDYGYQELTSMLIQNFFETETGSPGFFKKIGQWFKNLISNIDGFFSNIEKVE
ncbi:MAG: glycoside hydrolase family 18 protein, partial [Desulfobacterales bacterium]|nr:glycoside hydrolase family 18 protein [Desulfobacterales bacterium]